MDKQYSEYINNLKLYRQININVITVLLSVLFWPWRIELNYGFK